jgi:hypothetical protein
MDWEERFETRRFIAGKINVARDSRVIVGCGSRWMAVGSGLGVSQYDSDELLCGVPYHPGVDARADSS